MLGSLEDLRAASRGGPNPEAGMTRLAADVLWSDPVTTPGFQLNSLREIGMKFGPDVTEVSWGGGVVAQRMAVGIPRCALPECAACGLLCLGCLNPSCNLNRSLTKITHFLINQAGSFGGADELLCLGGHVSL